MKTEIDKQLESYNLKIEDIYLCLDVLRKYCKRELFKKMKVPNNIFNIDTYTKKFIKTTQLIKSIEQHNFTKKRFNQQWMKRNRIDLKQIDKISLHELFYKSINNYIKFASFDYLPKSKKYLTNDFIDFIYNNRTKKSWLLFAYFNEPIKRKTKTIDEIKKTLPDVVVEIMQVFKLKNQFLFWDKIKEIYDWFVANERQIKLINNFNLKKFDVVFLFKSYRDFLMLFENLRISNFGLNNKTWNVFVNYILTEYDIKLNFTKLDLQTKKKIWSKQNDYTEQAKKNIDEYLEQINTDEINIIEGE